MRYSIPEYLSIGADILGKGLPVRLRTCGNMETLADDMALQNQISF